MKKSCFQRFSTMPVMIAMLALAALSTSPACAQEVIYTWNLVSCGAGTVNVVAMPGKPGLGSYRFASSDRFFAVRNGDTNADGAGAQLRILRESATPRFG